MKTTGEYLLLTCDVHVQSVCLSLKPLSRRADPPALNAGTIQPPLRPAGNLLEFEYFAGWL